LTGLLFLGVPVWDEIDEDKEKDKDNNNEK
jgi:hypothetical protein